MKSEQIRKLLEVTAECGIPLQHAVGMVFRTRRQSPEGIARAAGYHRTYLYKALAGEIPVSPEMRASMREHLGVDPWAIYAVAGGCSTEQD